MRESSEIKKRVAEITGAPAPKAARHPPFPEIPEVERQLADKGHQADQRKARRQTAEARAERRDSRTSHKGDDRAEAARLARSEFPSLFSPDDRRALPLTADQHLVRYTGPNSALVKTTDDGCTV